METIDVKVKLTFTEEVLGTANSDPDIHGEYIASKAPDAKSMEEEIEAIGIEGVVEKAKTIFPKTENGEPFFYDYQIKGFFKDTTAALRKVPNTKASKIKAFKKEIDGLVFPTPRQIIINLNGGEIGDCQRPLRANTPQGERVALATSETVPIGSTVEFTVQCLTKDMAELVRECLDYGTFRGFGQWRNSGKGRFTWEEIK